MDGTDNLVRKQIELPFEFAGLEHEAKGPEM